MDDSNNLNDKKPLWINSSEPGKMLKVHIDSQVTVNTQNSNGLPLTVEYKRGFNTFYDSTTGELYDPKYPG